MDENYENLIARAWKQAYNAAATVSKKKLPDWAYIKPSADGKFFICAKLGTSEIGEISVEYLMPMERLLKDQILLKDGDDDADTYDVFRNYFLYSEILEAFPLLVENILQQFHLVPSLLLDSFYQRSSEANSVSGRAYVRDSYLKEQATASRRLINLLLISQKKQLDWKRGAIAHRYDLRLLKWREAKAFYKKNKKYQHWQEMLSLALKTDLPLDLLAKFESGDPEESMPSVLALEHAARDCGIEPNSLSLRSKQSLLKESKVLRRAALSAEILSGSS